MDIAHVRPNKHDLLAGRELPGLGRGVPVADVAACKLESHLFGLAGRQLDLLEAAEHAPGVVVAA